MVETPLDRLDRLAFRVGRVRLADVRWLSGLRSARRVLRIRMSRQDYRDALLPHNAHNGSVDNMPLHCRREPATTTSSY